MPKEETTDSSAGSNTAAHHAAPGDYCPDGHIESLFSSASQHFKEGDYAKSDCQLYEADARAECGQDSVPPLLRIKIKAKRGHLYEMMGHSREAIACYEAGIQIAENHDDLRVSKTVAIIHNNLASLKKDEKQWRKVEYHYKTSLLILELLEGGFSPKVAALYHNIGCHYARSLNYPRAIKLLKRAYKIRRICLGQDELHPDTKRTKMHLGATLLADGQWKEAKKYFAMFSKEEVDAFMERITIRHKRTV